jgi:periplasmic copper chaperone A
MIFKIHSESFSKILVYLLSLTEVFIMLNFKAIILSALLLFVSAVQASELEISDAWARATIPGQDVAAAYMTLTSAKDKTLFQVESPSADSVEIHTMTMNDGVMKMRMLKEIELKANEPVKLAPGGFHLMLFNLKAPLEDGKEVKFTLHFKDKAGETTQQEVMVPVKRSK